MPELFFYVKYKYCPGCGRQNKHTDRYCTVCHWWLGNVEAVEENLIENIKNEQIQKAREERRKEYEKNGVKPASQHLINQRMNYKYTPDEYNRDMFWYHFIDNFWWVLLLLCIISPIFNGGWLLIVISIGLIIFAIYKMSIVDDKYDQNRW